VGILIGDAAGPVGDTRVQTNLLDGLQDGIVVRNAAHIVVAENTIGAPNGEVRTGILFDAVSESRAEGNRISDARTAVNLVDGSGNRIGGNEVSRGGVGLLVDSDAWVEIDGNRLRETGEVPIQIGFWQGTARLHNNRCEYCGHGLPQLTAAIFAYVGLGELQIEHCELHHTGVSPDDGSVAQAIFGVLGLLILQASLQSNNIAAAVGDAGANALQGQHRAVYLLGFMDLQISDLVDFGFPAQLVDNRFTGLGDFPVVEIAGFPVNDVFNMRFNRVQYSDNFCWHLNRQAQSGASVVIASATASAMGNHFKWLQRITPVDFGATNALYMGNAADGVFAQGTSILPSPQNAFNR
jgi:hypothetical protein